MFFKTTLYWHKHTRDTIKTYWNNLSLLGINRLNFLHHKHQWKTCAWFLYINVHFTFYFSQMFFNSNTNSSLFPLFYSQLQNIEEYISVVNWLSYISHLFLLDFLSYHSANFLGRKLLLSFIFLCYTFLRVHNYSAFITAMHTYYL